MARPSNYLPEYAAKAEFLCRKFGAIQKDLAEYFEVSPRTIENWKNQHEDFRQALERGKTESDQRVVRALYERAVGYSHPETKFFSTPAGVKQVETMKHYPPDTGACVVWLGNRQRDKWQKDPQPIEQGVEDGEPTLIERRIIKTTDQD